MPASWIICGRHAALPWDACHKPHTLGGHSAIGFEWVESESALSLMAWPSCLVTRCKKTPEFPVVSFNTLGTEIFFFVLCCLHRNRDRPILCNLCPSVLCHPCQQPPHGDEKQRENTWNFLLSS